MRSGVRRLGVAALLLAMFALAPARAAAQGFGRGWFEQWSGPGPFYGTEVSLSVGCVVEGANDRPFVWLHQSGEQRDLPARFCLDFGLGTYNNVERDRARSGLVAFEVYQAVATWVPGNGAVEVGAGLGRGAFHGDSFDFGRQFIPLRASVKPFRFIDRGRGARSGIFRVNVNVLVFPEALRNEDVNFAIESFKHNVRPNIVFMADFSSFLFRR